MSLRRVLLVVIDIMLAAMAYIISFMTFRVSSTFSSAFNYNKYMLHFCVFLVCVLAARFFLKVYSSVWRYANTGTYLRIITADCIGTAVCVLITRLFLFDVAYINIWKVLANSALLMLGTLLSRFIYQYYMNLKNGVRTIMNRIPVAIVGAGKTGSLLAEELLYNSNSIYRPVCFIDVDKERIGRYLLGIKIIQESDDVVNVLAKMNVQEVFIALPSLTSEQTQRLYDFYSKTQCKIKLYDFAMNVDSRAVGNRQLRELRIEDLLFRDTHHINGSDIEKFYKGKTVLVTGGGGSIGSEICRQIAKLSPEKIIAFDIYENNLYDIQQEFVQTYGDSLTFCAEVGSVRDIHRLNVLFEKYRPDVVFHAAAHKHVPLMEHSCGDAVKNNVFGTYNCAECAEKYGVKRFILISTDKAVNPTNIMGATKRLCEMIIQSRHDSQVTEFAAVRFGNVLGSNGSVIPLFRRQIEAGGPVTLTDRRIIRYFMTIPEASQLVLQAGAMASSGELFVLDMGKPVKILDMAENMIKLAGFTPYKDIDIIETGLRPGEKLYEELLIKSENIKKTDNDLIFIETDTPYKREKISEKLERLKAVENAANAEIKRCLMELVPTYHDADAVNKDAEKSREMQLAGN